MIQLLKKLSWTVFVIVLFAGFGTTKAQADKTNACYCGGMNFNRIATFSNYTNLADMTQETVSEIVSVTTDGMDLVYTDSENESIGFVDIRDPFNPRPNGVVAMGGEPTSVSVLGNDYALVGVNTSDSHTNATGKLVVVSMADHTIIRELALNGQPDSVAISPDGRYAAIAIENERDEEICAGGTLGGSPVPEDGPEVAGDITEDACEEAGGVVGGLPQTPYGNPAGFLVIADIHDANPLNWSINNVDLTGLALYGADDPEPEFVDINADNKVVVTLQENNHVVVVDCATRAVDSHFSAGTVNLTEIDTNGDGAISLSDAKADVAREPDGVAWVPTANDGYLIATANEGDLFGGSRGFTLFDESGAVIFDSGNSFEHLAVQYGHYPEDRSKKKGTEPEAIEFGRYQEGDFLFVGSERGSFIAVYRMGYFNTPSFQQILPAPLKPEGVLAIPQRNLLVASGESDDPSYGVRSTIMIYQLQPGTPDYPQIFSQRDANGTPIPWSALSGLTSIPGYNDLLLGVVDSFYSRSDILLLDVSCGKAMVVDSVAITGGTGDYDPEGIAVAPDGTIWIASEGKSPGGRSNRLLQVDGSGQVLQEIVLPAYIEACRAASESTANLSKGFEGVAVYPTGNGNYVLLVAQQLPWYYTSEGCQDLDDDQGYTRIWIYDPVAANWSYVPYELAAVPENSSWVGLSEITMTPDNSLIVIERDNRTGDFAGLKSLVNIDPAASVDGVISQEDKVVVDVMGDLQANQGWITDKTEGFAITDNGQMYLATDNDGVDDWSGETWFLYLGDYMNRFGSR